MALRKVSLDDKFSLDEGRIFLNGTQALVRLTLMQRRRDLAAGLNTAGYVTGYRGSPLGGMDREFGAAARHLSEHHVKFHPAVNEDLAATAIWGAQQVNLDAQSANYDGVFGMWYGKGPGVDRSGDVFRHANLAGTSKHGGVLALAGDDPACKSSTVPSQSEHAIIDAQIPLLHPADTQEVLDYGILGWAMSRYSACWVGMKCITDNIDSSASVLVDPSRIQIVTPTDFEMPPGGLHIRWPDQPMDAEMRLHKHKVYAALAFARANGLNRVTMDSRQPRFGIISTGKSYLDTMQALTDLGIDAAEADRLGFRLLKIGMPWPLEKEIVRNFCEGLDEVLVIEEKRAVIENQVKEQLYNWRADVRPRVIGKFDDEGEWILPSAGELTPARIARVIAKRLKNYGPSKSIDARLRFLDEKEADLEKLDTDITRIPYFCSGCPHNSSTKIPEGSKAAAGIGCHYMVIWMDRETETFTHMGAEGANWIGQAPFTDREHIFTNIGDGTYFHSGILAIRAAVASGVNITYKILYNDAVAMTGGQTMDGPLDPAMVTRQVAAEGVEHIALVSDEPDKYPLNTQWAGGVTRHHRKDLDAIQRDFRERTGVSVIVYDQTCAAEKRRRRKRGTFPNPQKRAFINELVCEGCGDCGTASNCVSITPVETELGRKRAIDQSSCNKDYTCVDGFCPSFVTVHDAEPRKPDSVAPGNAEIPFPALPDPVPASAAEPYGIVIAGVGGTGIVTVSALLAMAAHMANKGVTVLDVAGLAQKNGAVYSHVKICDDPEKLHAVRLAAGGGDVLLGCDMVVAGSYETLSKLQAGRTKAVVNGHQAMTADFTRDPDLNFPEHRLQKAIGRAVGDHGGDTEGALEFVEATTLAKGLMGDTIGANFFLVGYAFQKGLLPLPEDAIHAAIDLNGVAPDFNKRAFLWGRRATHDRAAVEAILSRDTADQPAAAETDDSLDAFIARRAADLTAYQNAAYAKRYTDLIGRIGDTESEKTPGRTDLTEVAAKALYKLMAYKDEYEVARLYTDGRFEAKLRDQFDAGAKLRFHLAPPLLAERDPGTGRLRKTEYGPWVFTAFRLLAGLKGLRGTAFDIFGRSEERRAERRLIAEYITTLETLMTGLSDANHEIATNIARLPMSIRGFGHVKEANMATAVSRHESLMETFKNGGAEKTAAE